MQRASEWDEFKQGDMVRVFDANGRRMRGEYRFEAHVTNDAGVSWVDVFGGTHGHARWRSFQPDRIELDKRKRANTRHGNRGQTSRPDA